MRTEWVVVVLGLIVGYCLVSYLMSRGKASSPSSAQRSERSPEPAWSDAKPNEPSTGRVSARTWFQVLGIAESASREEIERAYRVSIGQYHPDKVARLGEDIRRLAELRSREINAAYDQGMRQLAS